MTISGKNCEFPNLCYPSPCANGATCQDLDTTYVCLCPPGYTGADCSTDISNVPSSSYPHETDWGTLAVYADHLLLLFQMSASVTLAWMEVSVWTWWPATLVSALLDGQEPTVRRTWMSVCHSHVRMEERAMISSMPTLAAVLLVGKVKPVHWNNAPAIIDPLPDVSLWNPTILQYTWIIYMTSALPHPIVRDLGYLDELSQLCEVIKCSFSLMLKILLCMRKVPQMLAIKCIIWITSPWLASTEVTSLSLIVCPQYWSVQMFMSSCDESD